MAKLLAVCDEKKRDGEVLARQDVAAIAPYDFLMIAAQVKTLREFHDILSDPSMPVLAVSDAAIAKKRKRQLKDQQVDIKTVLSDLYN